MKKCKCSGRARCAYCTFEVREQRGVWSLHGRSRRPRRRDLGVFSGTVGPDGTTVKPFAGSGPVSLRGQSLEPGLEVSYSLVEEGGVLLAERVRVVTVRPSKKDMAAALLGEASA